MLKPDIGKWNQASEDLRRLALSADHPRTRERFLCLHLAHTRRSGATKAASELGRDKRTTMRWIHKYNEEGPEALTFVHTGGPPPLCLRSNSKKSDV